MGASMSAELGEASLAQDMREYAEIAVHRLHANDATMDSLELPNFAIGDIGIAENASALTYATHLRSIDLGYNNIGPQGCAALCRALEAPSVASTLVELRLSGNPIGREGCRALCGWLDRTAATSSLKGLYLFQCDLDDECALLLANTFLRQPSITALNLDSNRFTKKAAIMFAQMLQQNKALAKLSFAGGTDAAAYPDAAMRDIEDALARNAELVAKREYMESVKAKKAQRRQEQQDAAKAERDAALAEERRRVEEELEALAELKRQEDEQVRALEAKMSETVARRNEKSMKAESQRREALERAIRGAYDWRNKLTANGTLQKEWRSGFTVMCTAPGEVGGTPTLSADAPRRLKACWCEPEDATAPYGNHTLHYHCKWEEPKVESAEDAAKGKSGYQGCKSSGHICASVGFYTNKRPDLSAPHFFASPHPGAAKGLAQSAAADSRGGDADGDM